MSKISQDFINNLGFLYENVHVKEQDFLNEESEYYDAELTEFVADILSTISSSMVCEGYSAEGIFSFLEISSDETIIEKYLNFDESFLTESVVEEGYIEEQLYLFDSTILEFLGALGRGAINLIGRVASKPARMAVAKKIMNSKDPARTAAAVDRWARIKLGKSGFNPNLVSKAGDLSMKTRMGKLAPALGKIRDIAKGAKAILPGVAKGALLAGTGVLTGYLGAKMGGAGEVKPSQIPRPDQPSTPPRRDNPPVTPPAAPPSGSGTPSGGGGGRGTGTPSGGAGGAGRSTSQTRTPQPSGQTGDKEKDMKTWARANPKLAAKVKPGQEGYEVISRLRDKPSDYEKQDQTPTQGSSTAQVDPSSVQADIEAEKERLRKRAEQQRNTTTPTTTTKESYEPYDIILEYLIGRGHADTINEANYIMMEMDQNAIGIIMQEFNDYLLAEEIQEWVNDLVEEGYDLSQYTWDDMVEYYVTEANKAERELGMNPRQREISRNLRYKNYYVKPSKRRPDSDFYNLENLKPKPKNTYSGDESDSWHDSMSQARRVRSKVNKNKT